MNVVDDRTRYCIEHGTSLSPECQKIWDTTIAHVPKAIMLSNPIVVGLLGFLIRSKQARRVLEIGCFTGFSALTMAESLPSEGELFSLDLNKDTASLAEKFWKESPHGSKIRFVLGPAIDTLPTLTPHFDLVYIDADKSMYRAYVEKCLPLLAPGGIIVLDNCLYSDQVLLADPPEENGKQMQIFNDWICGHSQLASLLLPIADGVSLVRHRNHL